LYSDLFVQWVTSRVDADAGFLSDLRQRFHDVTVTRNAAKRRSRWPSQGASNRLRPYR
jgi:hypothetical protein